MKKNRSDKKIKPIAVHLLILVMSLIAIVLIKAENNLISEIEHIEHRYGLYAIDFLKMVLGLITIVGAFGFFITSSPRRAHWPPYFRRFFFGTFIFCNIFTQAFFNVFSIPTNKKLVCTLGRCVKKLSVESLITKSNNYD